MWARAFRDLLTRRRLSLRRTCALQNLSWPSSLCCLALAESVVDLLLAAAVDAAAIFRRLEAAGDLAGRPSFLAGWRLLQRGGAAAVRPCSSHGAAVQAAHLDGRHRTDQATCQGGRGAHERRLGGRRRASCGGPHCEIKKLSTCARVFSRCMPVCERSGIVCDTPRGALYKGMRGAGGR